METEDPSPKIPQPSSTAGEYLHPFHIRALDRETCELYLRFRAEHERGELLPATWQAELLRQVLLALVHRYFPGREQEVDRWFMQEMLFQTVDELCRYRTRRVRFGVHRRVLKSDHGGQKEFDFAA